MSIPLDGLRVVDLTTGIAGAVATMLLADFGADVVRVSQPDGESARTNPSFAAGDRNKRAVLIDPSSTAGRAKLADLIAGADICVTGTVATEVLGPDELRLLLRAVGNPRLVLLKMPAFLDETPWAGDNESTELLSAVIGISQRQSGFTEGPVDPIYPHLLYEQGVWAATCAVAALIERRKSGCGQTVTVGGAHGALLAGYATFLIDPTQKVGDAPPGPGGPNPCYSRYQGSDGQWLFLGALTPKFQYPALKTLGLTGMLADPRLQGRIDTLVLPQNRVWVRERMAEVFRTKSRDEWLSLLEAAGCPAGPLTERDTWLDHPQLSAIGMRVVVEDPQRGRVVMPGIPLVLTASPGTVRTPAPVASSDQVISWPRQEASTPGPAAYNTTGPLDGLRVLDLGTILAGPLAGNLLAELGADVLKVEPPTGDPFRVTGFTYNRGMRSIGLDLRSDVGREAFYDLARSADVVIDNYRPGVLGRLKIDYDNLVTVSPRIISLSITGFGEGGPLAENPGFDPILQAMSGMMTAQGGNSEPVFLTLAVNDVTSGAFAALGACLATYHRDTNSGAGQRIWASLAGLSAFMQLGEITRYDGRPKARIGGQDYRGPSPLDRLYPTCDGWVRLQAKAEDVPLLHAAKLLPLDAIESVTIEALESAFAQRTRDDVVEQLTALGVPIIGARLIPEILNDPGVINAGLMQEHSRPSGAPYFLPGRLALFDRTQQTASLSAPGLGEHTRAILNEVGYGEARIDALIASGAAVEGGAMNLETFVIYR